VESRDEAEHLRSMMSRYMSEDLTEQLLNSTEINCLTGTPVEASVLFTHLSNYNSLAENLSLQALHELLNQLFEILIDAVFQHQGVVNQFIGADVMAVYGAPSLIEDSAWMAVQSALSVHTALQKFNEFRRLRNQESLDVRIGINSGEVISGNIGSSRRMEFTVVGHEVNLARHLSQLCQYSGYKTLIGENTRRLCIGRFHATLIDTVKLDPQGTSTNVYGVV